MGGVAPDAWCFIRMAAVYDRFQNQEKFFG
jgi:transcriptional regulator NrdR family protein